MYYKLVLYIIVGKVKMKATYITIGSQIRSQSFSVANDRISRGTIGECGHIRIISVGQDTWS